MITLPAENVSLKKPSEQKTRYLYVFFSRTPFKTGRFIRLLTNTDYNHVSVAVDPDFRELYSFARRYRNTPFCAGFVKESGTRFFSGGKASNVKICALPITEEQYLQACRELKRMQRCANQYVYNFFSAAVYPLHMRVRIPNAYTCVEFVTDFILRIGAFPQLLPTHSYTISELEALLSDDTVYRGVSPLSMEGASQDLFETRQSLASATRLTLLANLQLLKSFCKYRIFTKI